MRRISSTAVLLLFFVSPLLSTTVAFNRTLRVLDPQGNGVAGARVIVSESENPTVPIASVVTSGAGTAEIRNLKESVIYKVRVLAPGFAPTEVDLHPEDATGGTIRLKLATRAETVEVSATRTPLTGEEAATDVSTLTAAQLTTMLSSAASEALRFLPGAIVADAGRRGGLASLFVRGGDSRYNKVLIDDVPVNDPGGTFNFGVVPMEEVDRLEFARGAESTLYGSDAMTSVVQMWTRNGSTRTPELRFGADGGNYATAHGYASLSGARGRFDYNLFGDQFNTAGQGINDDYSNSSQGANLGVVLSSRAFLRVRARHANSRSGVQSFWNFNGQPLVTPDSDAYARQNDFLSSAELTLAGSRWQHRLTGFEYNHQRADIDTFMDSGRVSPNPFIGNFDFPSFAIAHINRAGFDYQGEYWARSWARTAFGYHFEDENGLVGDKQYPPLIHGLRRNHGVFGEQILNWRRFSLVGGLRYEHNETFGDRAVPRVTASFLARRGGELFSGTRLRFAYGEGVKAPRFEESFASGPFIVPNPKLKAESNRSLEAGVQQSFRTGKYAASATYFHNRFRDRIDFSFDPNTGTGQYVNVNRALAHGAELQFDARPLSRLTVTAAYDYTSTQILAAPFAFDPLLAVGRPLLRRPKHAGSLLAIWTGTKWGADVAGTFIGRRADSDFEGLLPPVTYAAGYGRLDLGGWRAITSRVTAYVKVGNATNRKYEQVAGYPALHANFRAGLRFRVGGE